MFYLRMLCFVYKKQSGNQSLNGDDGAKISKQYGIFFINETRNPNILTMPNTCYTQMVHVCTIDNSSGYGVI